MFDAKRKESIMERAEKPTGKGKHEHCTASKFPNSFHILLYTGDRIQEGKKE
jgi:hypothetical protein